MAEKQKEKGVSTVQVPAPKSKKNEYSLTRSCGFVNDFRKIILKKDTAGNKAKAEIGNVKISCENKYCETIQSEATAKLFDILRIVSHRQGKEFELRVSDYMRMRDISPNKRARKQFKESLEALKKCEFEYRKQDGTSTGRFTILKGFTLARGSAYVEFSDDFFTLLHSKSGYTLPYPLELLQTNKQHRNPNAYFIGVKLSEIYQKRQTIKASTLFKQVKTLLPPERVAKYRYKEDVISRFIRDLNSLECIKWEWVNSDGSQCNPSRYYEFLEATLKFEFLGCPETKKKEVSNINTSQTRNGRVQGRNRTCSG